jgi:hypothetical protein
MAPNVKRLEALDGPFGWTRRYGPKGRAALEAAGVHFIEETGGGSGVRLRNASQNLHDWAISWMVSSFFVCSVSVSIALSGTKHKGGGLAFEGRYRMPQRDHNPDRDFSAGYEELKSIPKYDYRDVFDDPVIRERIARLIARAADQKLDRT